MELIVVTYTLPLLIARSGRDNLIQYGGRDT
jgi:hypothetical protein